MSIAIFSPLAFIIFYISSQAETGRAPFDLIEAESELIAGFNIEYSGMKFGMFFAAEFLHVFTNGILMALLFFGGWMGPLYYESPIIAFANSSRSNFKPFFMVFHILMKASFRLVCGHVPSFNPPSMIRS